MLSSAKASHDHQHIHKVLPSAVSQNRRLTNKWWIVDVPPDSFIWTSQQRATILRENPGCTADSLPSLALDNPPTIPPSPACTVTHSPLPTSPPNPLVPGATICEFISALTALLSCHIASCTRRQSTITVLGPFIFHTPSFHLPLYRHATLPTFSLYCYPSLCLFTHPPPAVVLWLSFAVAFCFGPSISPSRLPWIFLSRGSSERWPWTLY